MLLRRLFCDDGRVFSRAGGAGIERFFAGLSSLLRAKREPEKHPLLSKRGRHEKGAARPFQTPKELSKPKNASRFAKRIFWASPIYGFAEGVTFQQDFTFSKGVKSAAKQQIGGELKCG